MIRYGRAATTSRARKMETFSRFLKMRGKDSFDDWSDLLTDDVRLIIPGDRLFCPYCGAFSGQKAFREAFETLNVVYEIIGDLEFDICLVDGDRLAALVTSPWRNRGSGRAIWHETFNVVEFERNKIKSYTLFFDTAILAEFSGQGWAIRADPHAPLMGPRHSSASHYDENLDVTGLLRKRPSKISRAAKTKLVKELMQVRNSGNFEALDKTTTDDVALRIYGVPTLLNLCGVYGGRVGLARAFRTLRAEWEALAVADEPDVMIDEDRLALTQLCRWRSRVSGATIQFRSANYFQLEHDRVREYALFVDTAALAKGAL
jgi:ketosteroid isomerase-like protein